MADVAKLKLNGTTYDIKDANVRAKLPIYVQDYGAKGNGTTNDAVAIQNAINAAQASNRPLEFEAGKSYLIGTPLEITFTDNHTHLIINGNDAGIFTANGIDAIRIHMSGTYDPSAYNWFTYVIIEDLVIQANSQFNGVGISFGTESKPGLDGKIVLDNVRIAGFAYALDYYVARNIYAINSSFYGRNIFRFNFYKRYSSDTGSLFNGDSFFTSCILKIADGGTAVSRRVQSGVTSHCNISGWHFTHCDFYGTTDGNSAYFDFNTASDATMARAFDWFFDNCQWDGINCLLFRLTSYGTNTRGIVSDIIVSNCYAYYIKGIVNCSGSSNITFNNTFFRLGVSTAPSEALTTYPILINASTVNSTTQRSKSVVFSNNIVEGMSTQPIYISASDNVTISGNIIKNGAWTAFQLANTKRVAITGNVIENDSSITNPSIYYLGTENTGYNISGNANDTTAIHQ